MPKRTIPPNEEIAALCSLRETNNVDDLTFKDLKTLSEESLKLLCVTNYFGDWWAAYRAAYKEGFQAFNHEQWDITLSSLAGTRLCGKPNASGDCPASFEKNLEFWRQHRHFTFLKQTGADLKDEQKGNR